MTPTTTLPERRARLFVLAGVLLGNMFHVAAQTPPPQQADRTPAPRSWDAPLYRVVSPDGRVTFTDRAPADTHLRVEPWRPGLNAAPAGEPQLPLALRNAMRSSPVVLYTSADCPPCDAGRRLLVGRGVPYTEKVISTDADASAFKQRFNATGLPLLTIGTQSLRGLQEQTWHETLSAAGYPSASQLPKNWHNPAPTPLVAPAAQAAASKASAPAEVARPKPEKAPAPQPSPSGIQF